MATIIPSAIVIPSTDPVTVLSDVAPAGATGKNSKISGDTCLASGENSQASGFQTQATALNSKAHGSRSVASGINSVASGTKVKSSGLNAIAEGNSEGNITQSTYIGETGDITFEPITALTSDLELTQRANAASYYKPYVNGEVNQTVDDVINWPVDSKELLVEMPYSPTTSVWDVKITANSTTTFEKFEVVALSKSSDGTFSFFLNDFVTSPNIDTIWAVAPDDVITTVASGTYTIKPDISSVFYLVTRTLNITNALNARFELIT